MPFFKNQSRKFFEKSLTKKLFQIVIMTIGGDYMKLESHFSVAEAKSRFSEVLHLAKDLPQFISSRGKEIGVILSREEYDKLMSDSKQNQPASKLKNFLKLSKTLREENDLQIKIPRRKDRESVEF